MLRKNQSILWALTDMGIIIQHLTSNTFYELDEVQERVWSYVDGTHTREDIIRKVSSDLQVSSPSEVAQKIDSSLDELLQAELILSVEHV